MAVQTRSTRGSTTAAAMSESERSLTHCEQLDSGIRLVEWAARSMRDTHMLNVDQTAETRVLSQRKSTSWCTTLPCKVPDATRRDGGATLKPDVRRGPETPLSPHQVQAYGVAGEAAVDLARLSRTSSYCGRTSASGAMRLQGPRLREFLTFFVQRLCCFE